MSAAIGRPPARMEILAAGDLGGCEPEALAGAFGTPLYVYDLDAISARVEALRAVLPPRVEVAYAVKANPSLGIVAHLAGLGVGADVASRGELATALRAGMDARSIVMTGPGKRDDELAAAVDARIRAVTVESPAELARLERLAATTDRRVPVLLRASVGAVPGAERVRLVGDEGAGKFGMSAADLEDAAARAVRADHLELLGVHAFGASNVLDADALADHAERTVELARTLASRTGVELRLVDVGGGLGIPYADDERPLDLAALGRRLAALDQRMAADPLTRSARLLLEPGRFLVGPAGAYLARVVDRKTSDGRTVVIVDGGIHHVLRPALTRQAHRIVRVAPAPAASDPSVPVTVAGPLCSGLDVLAAGVELPAPHIGDLLAVLDVGAYGFTESMLLFLSHPIPAEVALREGRAHLLRPRVEPEAWLDEQRLPGA